MSVPNPGIHQDIRRCTGEKQWPEGEALGSGEQKDRARDLLSGAGKSAALDRPRLTPGNRRRRLSAALRRVHTRPLAPI